MSHPFLVEIVRLEGLIPYVARIRDSETGLVVHETAPQSSDALARAAARRWIRSAEKNGGGERQRGARNLPAGRQARSAE